MLDENRKHYVTASQAHRIMAGFESELIDIPKPHFEESDLVLCHLHDCTNKPKVGELKSAGLMATGAQISSCWEYHKSLTPVFTTGMESVAREIAMAQFLDERDEQYQSEDMERGNIQEREAIIALSEHLGVEFFDTEDDQTFFTKGSLGVTPDGVQYDSDFNVEACGEVKNPKDTSHMYYLLMINSQDDLLRLKPEYYWQAQAGLAVTGAKSYHWASYHNGFRMPYRLVYVHITPNLEHIRALEIRAARVAARVPEIVDWIKRLFSRA